jgi:hypothetical membrane protein
MALRDHDKNRHQVAVWAGMIAPALFVGTFTIEGWIRPGYDPFREYVSGLSTGPRGWIQIANFVVVGLLLLTFARGVSVECQERNASRSGPLLLAIIAISLLLSGPFIMDPPGVRTVHGTLHAILGAVVFSLMPINCFVFLRLFREVPAWRSLKWWTVAAGTIITTAVIILTIATKVPSAAHPLTPWLGVIQRAALVPYMCWLFLFALRLRRRTREIAM